MKIWAEPGLSNHKACFSSKLFSVSIHEENAKCDKTGTWVRGQNETEEII